MRKRVQFERENTGRLAVPMTLPFDYELRPALTAVPRELIILLHGFAESGSRILGKLVAALPEEALVLAPNAPFPMPHKTDQGYVMTYAWYFYDPMPKEYFIDMQPALGFLDEGVRALNLSALPKRIIGFSQGGYLAPFAAQRLTGVKHVVGLACEYLSDELLGEVPFRIDAVHGSDDAVISASEARLSHQTLSARKIAGQFQLLEGGTHRIDNRMREELRKLLRA